MFQKFPFRFAAALVAVALLATTAWAETISWGGTTVNMDFVTVGNPGNAGDTVTGGRDGLTGYGSVGYTYRIGKYEVSSNQYHMVVDADEGDLLSRFSSWPQDRPAADISLAEMAMFANWLTSGDVTQGAYEITENVGESRIELTGIDRVSALGTYETVYALPTDDEWYKAAYHKNDGVAGNYWDYPTGSDTEPTEVAGGTAPDTAVVSDRVFTEPADVDNAGGLSPYGTMGQGGNVWERTESLIPEEANNYTPGPPDLYSVRGGSFARDHTRTLSTYGMLEKDAYDNSSHQGFRVMALEPGVDVIAEEFEWIKDSLGDWSDAGNWSPTDGGVPPSPRANNPNHSVTFPEKEAIMGPTTVNTHDAVTVNRIAFANTSHSFVVSGIGSVNLQATTDPDGPVNPSMSVEGTHQFQAIVNLANDTLVDVASGSTLSFNNALNLNGMTLTKMGVGALEINNQLTSAGGSIIVQEGTVAGYGAVGGDVTNLGGTISPGDGPSSGSSVVPEPGSMVLTWISMMALLGAGRQFRRT